MAEAKALTPQQAEIVHHWGQGLAILAGAGSGKTTTLVEKSRQLMAINPQARFAAVSFTERSAADLELKLSQALSLKPHCVSTIHGLCGRIIREFPESAGIDGDEAILPEAEARRLWEESMDSLWVASRNEDPRIRQALEKILVNENRQGLLALLTSVKNWETFGVVEKLQDTRLRDEGQGPLSLELSFLARTALERFQRSKQRLGVIDFADLEKAADRALQDPAVCQALRSRYDLVMIDEFQDTNPVQAKIVWRMVKKDLSNLVVVGDPKQSIYRFRDADVSLFEELVKELPKKMELSWNFRSRPALIDFVNAVCQPVFASSGLTFQPLEARRPPAETLSPPVLKLEIQSPEDLAQWLQQQRAEGRDLGQMVILMRKLRGDNEKWLRALSRAGIPLAVGSGGRFWQDPRVRELASLLLAWQQPENSLAAMVFLRAPWVAVPDLTLDAWALEIKSRSEPGLSLLQKFLSSPDFQGHPIADALRALPTATIRPAEVLLQLLEISEVEENLGHPLLGLWHRCEEWSAMGWGFFDISRHLARILSREEDPRESDLPPPRNQGQLRVMSVHAAKGLEFKQVILLDFAGKTRAPNAPPLYWDRRRGVHWVGREEDGSRSRDDLSEEWKDWDKTQDLAESKRVFYVALTRAEERVILVCLPLRSPVERWQPSDLASDNWRAWIEYSADRNGMQVERFNPAFQQTEMFSLQAAPATRALPRDQAPDLPLRRARHSVSEWLLLNSCPRAYEWRYIRPRIAQTPDQTAAAIPAAGQLSAPVTTADEMPEDFSASQLGTEVHALLEKADQEGMRLLENRYGSQIFAAQPLLDWLQTSPLGAVRQAGLAGEKQVFHEVSFEIPLPRLQPDQALEVLVGTIDKLVIEGGHAVIVDYKVSQRGKSARELLSTYQQQLEIYAWAVRQLCPSVSSLQAVLVQITPQTVQEVKVPLPSSLEAGILARLQQAQAIIAGEAARPRPGKRCRHCDYRHLCPEGRLDFDGPHSDLADNSSLWQ